MEDKITRKISKILLFVGVTVYFLVNHIGTFNTESIITALMFAVLAYIAVTLYGILLKIIPNYIVSLIAWFIIVIYFCDWMSKLEKQHIMTGQSEYYIVLAFGCLCALFDVYKIIKYIKLSRLSKSGNYEQIPEIQPQAFLNASYMFEQQFGRKPTADEVLTYIDTINKQ